MIGTSGVITRAQTLDGEIEQLWRLLDHTLSEQDSAATSVMLRRAYTLAQRRRAGEADAEAQLSDLIASLSLRQAHDFTRAATILFDLMNLSEDRQRVRVLRELLELIARSLRRHHADTVVAAVIDPWIVRTRAMGFHLARLDIPQESGYYRRALTEVFQVLGVCDNYAALGENDKREVLHRTMGCGDPLPGDRLSDATREALTLFDMLVHLSHQIGQDDLLRDTPWLARSLEQRNPLVDPLNLLQVHLMRKFRAGQRGDDSSTLDLDHIMRLTVQGIAAGMRTTG